MSHIPVLLNEILEATSGLNVNLLFDGTFGRGGHLEALMNRFPDAKAVAFDRDPDAIAFAQDKFASVLSTGKLTVVHRDYRDLKSEDFGLFDFMLLDLGVSSPQLDLAHRGFSFYHDGPLDMRMNSSEGPTAADILNESSEEELIRIFQELGEVRKPYRVVRAIVHDRKEKLWESTKQLAGMIERVEGWKVKGHHPATQFFMALRMAVNTELEGVHLGIRQCMAGLKDGGRLAVITFHSLEDRIVKQIFRGDASGFCVNKKVIQATEEEVKINPRARSAKLRIFQKGKPSGDRKKFYKEFN
ncbi:MAG: S-adenosyl-methyltransferase [Pseudomonadota bacterium]|jgi:16S rRNA (cytosine1402-N4)-methyltransferase